MLDLLSWVHSREHVRAVGGSVEQQIYNAMVCGAFQSNCLNPTTIIAGTHHYRTRIHALVLPACSTQGSFHRLPGCCSCANCTCDAPLTGVLCSLGPPGMRSAHQYKYHSQLASFGVFVQRGSKWQMDRYVPTTVHHVPMVLCCGAW